MKLKIKIEYFFKVNVAPFIRIIMQFAETDFESKSIVRCGPSSTSVHEDVRFEMNCAWSHHIHAAYALYKKLHRVANRWRNAYPKAAHSSVALWVFLSKFHLLIISRLLLCNCQNRRNINNISGTHTAFTY